MAAANANANANAPQYSPWWYQVNRDDYPDEDFKKYFGMQKSTFNFICDELNAAQIANQGTSVAQNRTPMRVRVGYCVSRLATGDSLKVAARRFGMPYSTCQGQFYRVLEAIEEVMGPKYVVWPDYETMREIKATSGIDNVVGALYAVHFDANPPPQCIAPSAYYNESLSTRRGRDSFSTLTQGLVDARGLFINSSAGWAGALTKVAVLKRSRLYQCADQQNLHGLLNGFVVGDPGYPSFDWLKVPYEQPLTSDQHVFNSKLEEIHNVAKDAFATLRGRWSILQKALEGNDEEWKSVIGACIVLHNLCELKGDTIDPALKVYWDEG